MLLRASRCRRPLGRCLHGGVLDALRGGVVDAGGPFGYGHFMRCRELAGQVVERLSWPATFLVDDERAAQMAEASGFGVVWGALGRPTREEASGRRARVKGDMASECDLAVVDITVRRSLEPGWRDLGFGDRPPPPHPVDHGSGPG